MNTTFERRVAALEAASSAGIVLRVAPPAIAADPARLAAWRAEIEATVPAGTRVTSVLTGVPRHGDPA